MGGITEVVGGIISGPADIISGPPPSMQAPPKQEEPSPSQAGQSMPQELPNQGWFVSIEQPLVRTRHADNARVAIRARYIKVSFMLNG
jgi:hypothetical protein